MMKKILYSLLIASILITIGCSYQNKAVASVYPNSVAALMSKNIGNSLSNLKTWGNVAYQADAYGIIGDGVTDVTGQLQELINLAISEGRKLIMFPHGTYYVTSLENADQVFLIGDNASFTGGYTGTIDQFGGYSEEINDLKKRFFLYVGDSYMVGTNGTSNKIPLTIASLIDCDWKNYAVGGTGFVRQVSGVDFAAQLTTAANDTTIDKDAVTDIIVAGGYNDLGVSGPTQEMFETALANINALVKANFKRAKLTVIPFPWININYNSSFSQMQQYIINACQKVGCNYSKYALSWLIGYDSSYQSGDNIHPSDKGYEVIAEHILSVRNGTNDSKFFNTTITNSLGTFGVYLNNNRCTIVGTITLSTTTLITNLLVLPSTIVPTSIIPWYLVEYGGASQSYRGLIFGSEVSLQGNIPAGTYVVNIDFTVL